MHKRFTFSERWLAVVLLLLQLTITLVFFIWPAIQALWQSVLQEDPFGLSVRFVGLDNFLRLFSDERYLNAVRVTLIFSVAVAISGISIALLLAVMADHVVRGAAIYRTLLIWPYAVAPAIAGLLWFFMFHPTVGILAWLLRQVGIVWNHKLNGNQAMLLVIIAATRKQISYFLSRRLAGDPAFVDRGSGDRWCLAGATLLEDRVPTALADHVLFGGRQLRLRVL